VKHGDRRTKREIQEKVSRLVTSRFGGDYHKAFDHYDSQPKDGKISGAELMQLLRDAGIGNWLTATPGSTALSPNSTKTTTA